MDTFEDFFGVPQIDVRDLARLDDALSHDGLMAFIRKTVAAHGLRHAVYHSPSLPGRRLDDPFLALTYDSEWIGHYRKSNYVSIDPVVAVGARSVAPLDWATLDRSNRKVSRLFDESREAGVGRQGLTFPVRGPENGLWGLFSVTTDDCDPEWRRRRRLLVCDLLLVAQFVHLKAYDLHNAAETPDLNCVTRRETEALAWTSEGKTVADVAALMKISGETVKAHLDSARQKLGALTRAHAVAKAIRSGIIR